MPKLKYEQMLMMFVGYFCTEGAQVSFHFDSVVWLVGLCQFPGVCPLDVTHSPSAPKHSLFDCIETVDETDTGGHVLKKSF